jgi:hypothetical protein
MATYSISINNNYGAEQNYFLFAKAPEVTNNDQVYSNALAHVLVQNDGSGSFAFNKTYHAICGHTSGSLATGTVISTYQKAVVQLSTNKDGSNVPMQGQGPPNIGAKFDVANIKKDWQTEGTFVIRNDEGFTLKGMSNPNERK